MTLLPVTWSVLFFPLSSCPSGGNPILTCERSLTPGWTTVIMADNPSILWNWVITKACQVWLGTRVPQEHSINDTTTNTCLACRSRWLKSSAWQISTALPSWELHSCFDPQNQWLNNAKSAGLLKAADSYLFTPVPIGFSQVLQATGIHGDKIREAWLAPR